jgi:hypothetical protein
MKPYTSAAYGLKAVSPPTGRCIHHQVAWLAQTLRLVADGTYVQDALLLLPVGTTYHGTLQNTIELAKCKVSYCSSSHKQAEPAVQRAAGLLAKAAGSAPHSPTAYGELVSVRHGIDSRRALPYNRWRRASKGVSPSACSQAHSMLIAGRAGMGDSARRHVRFPKGGRRTARCVRRRAQARSTASGRCE